MHLTLPLAARQCPRAYNRGNSTNHRRIRAPGVVDAAGDVRILSTRRQFDKRIVSIGIHAGKSIKKIKMMHHSLI